MDKYGCQTVRGLTLLAFPKIYFWGRLAARGGGFETPEAYAIQRATLAGGGGARSPTVLFFCHAVHGFRPAEKPRRAYHFAMQSVVSYT